MEEINRLNLTVSGAYAYRARINYKNPGQSDWTRTENLANVSKWSAGTIYLKDVPGIQEGATVQFVMDIRLGRTVVASEKFTYKRESFFYASYNGTGTTIVLPKARYMGRYPYANLGAI